MNKTALKNDSFEITLPDGRVCHVIIKKHKTAKRISMRIRTKPFAHVFMNIPYFSSVKTALKFATSQIEWIARMLPDLHILEDSGQIYYRGKLHHIRWVEDARIGRAQVNNLEDGDYLCIYGSQLTIAETIKRWLKKEAEQRLPSRVKYYAEQLECDVKSVKLCDYHSHWGRCSHQGEILMSWRLIMAPDFVSDYVAAHEASHLRELNHSKKFWDIVETLVADSKDAQDWLKKFGTQLQSY